MNDQRGSEPTADDGAVFRFDPADEPAAFDDFVADEAPRRGLFDDIPDLEPPSASSAGEMSGADDAAWNPFAPPTGEQPESHPSEPIEGYAPSPTVGGDVGADLRDGVEPAFRFDDGGGDPTGSLPHWTEPSTGVMDLDAIAAADDPPRTAEEARIDAWATQAEPGPVWNDGERERGGPRTGQTNTVIVGGWDEPDAMGTAPAQAGERDLNTAIVSGVALAAGIAALLVAAPTAVIVVLVAALATLAVGEVYTAFRHAGHRPAHLLGLAATVGLVLGAYWKGTIALPLLLVVFVMMSFAHYVVEPTERPLSGWALTVSTVMWIGLPASFAALMLRAENGRGAFAVAIIAAVAADVGGYFVGRAIGRSSLSASISPNKTWEGLFGGVAVCVVVLVALSVLAEFQPIDSVVNAVIVGLVLSCAVPLGDLSQSLIKRDLGVKDMGNMIPGHGGLTDRFDGLLFSLAATWLVLLVLDLAPAGALP